MRINTIDLRELDKRIPLHEVVPLAAPFSLYIEPTSWCNLGCKFCPTGWKHLREQRPNGIMPLDLFKKIVDDIAEFGVKLKKVNLYKDGEPLLHKQFPEMVRYLADAGVVETIWTKTNGFPLNPALNERLADCGLDFLGISVNHVTDAGYLDITQRKVKHAELVESAADLYRRQRSFKLFAKILDTGFTQAELDKFCADWEPITDYYSIEYPHGWSASDTMDFKLGTQADTFEGAPLVEKIACPLPFFMLGINWDGTVSLCNEDWMHGTVVGDLKQESLKDVWNGDRLRKMRLMHLSGRRKDNIMCGNCDYLRTLPDNIDPFREEIAGKI
jgi:radical SAM protein with 4Fe4S-binding SPASM domain